MQTNNWDSSEVLKVLESKTIKDPRTGCWLFTGYCDDKGYGRIRYRGRVTRVHRVSAHLHLEYDLTDKYNQVLHKLECTNRNCWNPAHLYIGTHEQNMIDKKEMGNAFSTKSFFLGDHCNNGHERAKYQDGTGHCRECDRLRHRGEL